MHRLSFVILLCACSASPGSGEGNDTDEGASSSSGTASTGAMTSVDPSATSPTTTSSSDGSSSEGDDAPSESSSGSETGDDTGGPSIACGDAMHGRMPAPETVAWTNVLPVAKGNGLVADPAISGDFYVFYQVAADNTEESRVQKTSDFGETWTDIEGSALNGNAWGVAIDPNRDRCVGQDPCPPPTLYRPAGYGFNNPDGTALGMWKSTDGGATWNNLFRDYWDGEVPTPDGGTAMIPPDGNGVTNDFYAAHVLPDDPPNHVLVTYHYGSGQLLETTDGGETWEVHSVPWGTSHYAFGFDAETWIVIPQQFDAPGAMYRTTTAGRVDGVISTEAWTQVDTSLHCHGAFTPWIDPTDCSVVIAGSEGTKRTFDQGATWELVDPNGACTVSGSPDLWFISGLFSPSARRLDIREEPVASTPYDFGGDWQGIPPYGTATAWDEANAQWVILATQYGGGVWRITVAG
jgi:hypothetical protein